VINGSLLLLPGAEITGNVLVVGGDLALGEGTRIGGRKEVYWDAAPVVRSPRESWCGGRATKTA
jgi:hypothetical protein